ncbi:MAG: N-acetylmuramoyl-L-alanine amidase [Oscillospiraceae bacterium]|jgi:N-acetyl-anhydromuramyl-L-alanine amidase AmpD|nr:N-acetylmuramoyl-L-alanine amidase [Oscillospiraceae bacterium]
MGISIIKISYKWNGALVRRRSTDSIVLHHCASNGLTAERIHALHLSNGWAGIGYHYYIRKNGDIFTGRPEDTVGAHSGASNGYNAHSIAACFEGDYETEAEMPEGQLAAGAGLISDILRRYGGLKLIRHRDISATACPGKNFPYKKLAEMVNASKETKGTEEVEKMIVYNNYDDLPEWGRETVKKLMDRGALIGDEKGSLALSYEMLRVLVINDRMGLYS